MLNVRSRLRTEELVDNTKAFNIFSNERSYGDMFAQTPQLGQYGRLDAPTGKPINLKTWDAPVLQPVFDGLVRVCKSVDGHAPVLHLVAKPLHYPVAEPPVILSIGRGTQRRENG